MALKIDIRKDPLFEKGKDEGLLEGIEIGIEEGIEKKSRLIVVNLIKDTDFNDEKIALLAAVKIEFVQAVRKAIGM